MGLSFNDEESMAEATNTLRFGSMNHDTNLIPDTEDVVDTGQQENRGDDIGDP